MATNKVRVYVLTGGVAVITATGAWYGAGLNMRQEFSREKAKIQEATTSEKLAQLHTVRDHLLRSKDELQAKIDKLQGKENVAPPSATAKTTTGMQGTIEGRTRTS